MANDQEDMHELKLRLRAERKQLELWHKPLKTSYLFVLEMLHLLYNLLLWLLGNILYIAGFLGLVYAAYFFLISHDDEMSEQVLDSAHEAAFWIFLGILSSVGLGTGLHTFILYLGPYIANVTIHAYTCNSTDFPPPFHSTRQSTWGSVVCPDVPDDDPMSIWRVMAKVRFPAIMWGVGTAIGELPPYFVARAARMSEDELDDEDLEEFHQSLQEESTQLSVRAKKFIHNLVQKAGFWGIFACAAIPNPLFDLAGLTCGHFQVPFMTFFGATVLGKAIFKVHIQMTLLIVAMSKPVFDAVLAQLQKVPGIGDKLYEMVRDYQSRAQAKFAGSQHAEEDSTNVVAMIFASFVVAMIVYFLASIVGQLAQRHQHRLDQAKLNKRFKTK